MSKFFINCALQTRTMASTNKSPKLIWLLAMHRHGDREPLNMGSRDKYNDIKYWPEGFGNLNNAGRKRLYKLGQFIRKRYSHFLTDNFRESYSRSSDIDRCIESAHVLLAGLYPPNEQRKWNNNLSWTPFPVHSVPPIHDYLLNEAGQEFVVPTAKEIIKICELDVTKKLMADSEADRILLEKEIGVEFDNFIRFRCVQSCLYIEKNRGYEMPSWYTNEFEERLYYYSGKAFALAAAGTERMSQIRAGHLLDDIVRRMELANSTDYESTQTICQFHQPTNEPNAADFRKFVHYSTHDTIIASFLGALNLLGDKPIPPGFAATVFVELYLDEEDCKQENSDKHPTERKEQKGKFVKIYYLDDTESENVVEQKLPNCQLDDRGRLSLSAFKNYVSHLLPKIAV